MQALFIANLCIWIGIGGYIFFLDRRYAALDRRMRQLEIINGNE